VTDIVTTIKNAVAGHLPVAYADDDDQVEIVETPGSSKSRKKVTKGRKKRTARNLAQTGNNDGKFLDIDTIVLDEGDDVATATRKGEGKAKPQVDAPVTSNTKPKSKPKSKGMVTADRELSDVEKSHSPDIYIDCECHLNIVRLATQLNLHSKSKWHEHPASCHYHCCVKQWSPQEAG
jgi:hypothetical protein